MTSVFPENALSTAGTAIDWQALALQIKDWGKELGFAALGISPATPDPAAEAGLLAWLDAGCHGGMDYMARHGLKRARPAELLPGTLRVISARLPYWPQATDAQNNLADGTRAYVSRYALGRDYHKPMRNRLQQLALRIEAITGPFIYRPFSDSAPILEGHFAQRAGLGWRGKHTLLLTRESGSGFFLGELLVNLPLPIDAAQNEFGHCGTCTACLSACPTQAIIAPGRVDARRCISYLTIELDGPIPLELRPLMGNRIYGCDDCQLCCPWQRPLLTEKTRQETPCTDFAPRQQLDQLNLIELFAWTENEFKARLAGSPIHRIGHERWLRNIAVALGNAPTSPAIITALRRRQHDASSLVREHVCWALAQHNITAG